MINYQLNHTSYTDILTHLQACDHLFPGSLSSRVELATYSDKIFNKAQRFEAWNQDELVGLIAAYHNDEKQLVYITSVSVLEVFAGQGIAKQLLTYVINFAKENNTSTIELEVHKTNEKALTLYESNGFVEIQTEENTEMKKLVYFVSRNEEK
jgi:ribosomal protein S18 acetylase RimI-like enzyme